MARTKAIRKNSNSLDCIMRIADPDDQFTVEKVQPIDPFEGLNEVQAQAVAHDEGPAILCAVAGAGKTRVVTHRLVRLINSGSDPERILATTFTRKAAGEMKERAAKMGCNQAHISTFHSLCLEIIRKDSQWRDFEVDAKDRMRFVLKEILGWRGMDWKGADITEVLSYIGACKNALVRADEPAPDWFRKMHPDWFSCMSMQYARAYQRYEEERESRKLLTFDDMLCLSYWHLEEDAFAKSYWQEKFEHVMVDEFQDSNRAQYELMRLLAEHAKSLLAVADDDQLVYNFRGSLSEYTIEFEQKFNARVMWMEQNYRSTPEILDAANRVIVNNQLRIIKVNQPTRESIGIPVVVESASDLDAEAEKVCEHIKELHEDGSKWGDCAILYRTNAQSRAFEEVFIREKVPHVIVGGMDFYKRKEVADILAYLRLAVDESDNGSCKRAINRPFRYIGKVTLDLIEESVAGGSMFRTISEATSPGDLGVRSRQFESIMNFVTLVRNLQSDLEKPIDQGGPGLPMALTNLITASKYEEWLIHDEGTETAENSRLSNLRELVRTAVRFTTAKEMLEHIDGLAKLRRKKKNEKVNAVQVMTVHKSKGLEFPTVFLAGCVENVLPHAKAENVEEERRLFYVGVTRAKDRLYIMQPMSAMVRGKEIALRPSRFIAEAGLSKIESNNE